MSTSHCSGTGTVTSAVIKIGRDLALLCDGAYRLTSAAYPGTLVETYGYDAFDRRVWIYDGTATNYLIHAGPHVVAETDSAGTLTRSYTYGPGIDNILSMTVYSGGTTTTYWYITDHLNTVWALVDTDGSVVESYDYDAFGNVKVFDGSGTPVTESAVGNRFLFQGREYSWATGLYYFRARYCDPTTGRWLSKDPIGIAGGLNQYVFCGNNPVNFTDPDGLRIRVSDPAHRQVVSQVLSTFVRGEFSFDSQGFLQRKGGADDCEIEADIDRLIQDPRLYDIIPERYQGGPPGIFMPWSQVDGDLFWYRDVGRGGRIYFDPSPSAGTTYPSREGRVPHTGGTILAHELLGRAIADYYREPTGRLGSPARRDANDRAVIRANPAFDRIGVLRRTSYR